MIVSGSCCGGCGVDGGGFAVARNKIARRGRRRSWLGARGFVLARGTRAVVGMAAVAQGGSAGLGVGRWGAGGVRRMLACSLVSCTVVVEAAGALVLGDFVDI